MATKLTRAERKSINRLAHRLRREATNEDYRAAKNDSVNVSWSEIWEAYASMSNDSVIATFGTVVDSVETCEVATVEVCETSVETCEVATQEVPKKRKSTTPPHIQVMASEYRLAMDAWEAGLESALCGGRRNGKPANGEQFTDEERDYRDANPCPQWSDWLQAYSAEKKHNESLAA